MNKDASWLRRNVVGMLLGIALVAGIWLALQGNEDETSSRESTQPLPQPRLLAEETTEPRLQQIDAAEEEVAPELTEEEQLKLIDGENLKQLHAGIFAYRDKFGEYPEFLSQLVPDFVDADALISPRGGLDRSEHADPGIEKPSYGYEFSNVEFRDGRTFAEIKDVQRSEWGDVVPMLRSFGYSDGKVLNMSYAGELYETRLNWEWDPATLDVVAELGWGPGLTEGEFSEVRVLDKDGSPVAGADVWADGRHYSFDLPNRPFQTDNDGYARIPLGVDLDRTELVLRVATDDGQASAAVAFESGAPPKEYEMTVTPSLTVGGTVVDSLGQPVENSWLYLKNGVDPDATGFKSQAGQNRGGVKTVAIGQWSADLHPDDAAAFGMVVATPEVIAPKYEQAILVNPRAAAQQSAVVELPLRDD